MASTKSFLIVTVNRTARTYSIEGPICDDTQITERVVTAQLLGFEINCHNPGTLDASRVADWAQKQGLVQVRDAMRGEGQEGPWDVFSPEGKKIGRIESNINFDLWFNVGGWALVKGDMVEDHGKRVGYLCRNQNQITYHPDVS